MGSLPGDKGARKPGGLLCSSHTLEHRYQDEMGKPWEKRSWRKLAKRREAKIWKREAKEEMMSAFYEIVDVTSSRMDKVIYLEVEDTSDGGDFAEEIVMTNGDAVVLVDELIDALKRNGVDYYTTMKEDLA